MKKAGNSRILMLFFLLLVCAVWGCSKGQSSKPFTVGVVNLNKELDKVFLGFKGRLAALGYVEGQNINYIYNGPSSNLSDLESDLNEFIQRDVDLIFSLTTPATQKTKLMTRGTGIPVVFAPVFDPVRAGIVESLMKPGSNLTGIKVGGNSSKALDWFLKINPQVKNILVPFNNNNMAAVLSLEDLQKAAEKLG
ncbi:MAG: hypothetical protein JRF02_05245, partial [Deltaproteobacteria bacterium]|nr:hypothetical protein [Deltaproteobacteria bacterium]